MSDTLVPHRPWLARTGSVKLTAHCRERAGRAADLELPDLTIKRSAAFNRAFRKGPSSILGAGAVIAFELGRAAEGTEIWHFLEREKLSTLGLKHLRGTLAVHYEPDHYLCLTEEAGVDNRCFCRDIDDTIHAVSISRIGPRTWCISMPERYKPEILGGVWKKRTVVLGFSPNEHFDA